MENRISVQPTPRLSAVDSVHNAVDAKPARQPVVVDSSDVQPDVAAGELLAVANVATVVARQLVRNGDTGPELQNIAVRPASATELAVSSRWAVSNEGQSHSFSLSMNVHREVLRAAASKAPAAPDVDAVLVQFIGSGSVLTEAMIRIDLNADGSAEGVRTLGSGHVVFDDHSAASESKVREKRHTEEPPPEKHHKAEEKHEQRVPRKN